MRAGRRNPSSSWLCGAEPVRGFSFGAERSRYIHSSPADFRFSEQLARTEYLQKPALDVCLPAFSRNSPRLARGRDGNWISVAAEQPAILPGIGYDHREQFANLSPNGLDPRAIPDNGATSAAEPGTFAGFSSAARVVSAGEAYHRKRDFLSSPLANGGSYGFSFLYAEGSSANAAFIFRNGTTAQTCYLAGPHGSLTNTVADCGKVTDIVTTPVEPGVWLVEAVFTATTAGTDWSAGAGPFSAAAGDDIVLIAQQVADKPFPMPFASGATANERMEFAAGALGMAVDPTVAGVTAFWRGRIDRTDASYRAALEILIDGSNRVYFQRNGTNDRLEVVMQRAAGYATAASSASPASALLSSEVVLGVTLRPDGSVRAVAADNGFADLAGQSLPTGVAAFVSIGSFKGSPSVNGTTSRVVLIPEAISDGEFEGMFARVR